jgi:hypothetical protein
MATPFSDVYNPFLDMITDPDLLVLEDTDRDSFLHGLMISACSEFESICRIDLTDRNETSKQFNNTLTDEVIKIINKGMVVEWIKPKYYFNDNMKNSLNTKDYSTFSPANLLKEMKDTYLTTKKEFEGMMNKYSYMNEDFEDLKPY